MKHILVKKVSHVKAILILGTGLLVPAAAIAGGWATYNYFEKKNYKSFVEFGKTEQLAGASTPLTNENFVKQMESLPLEAKYKQYSPSQIFNLVLDKKNPINLISIFDLSDFKQKYPNIKINAHFITSDLAANNTIATAQQLENVLFTAVDNATNQIYSSVVNVSGFGEAQTTRVPVFSVDETQSKLVYNNFNLTDDILPSALASNIQSFYTSHNQDFGQTVSNFGSLKLINANGSNIVVPSELRLDFAKNSENQIAFDKIDDNSGSLIVSVEILDGNNKVGQFKLQITNLNSYKLALQEFTKLTSDVTNPDRNPVKLIADKQREIALSQKNLSTFFKEGQDVTDFFDFNALKSYFKHLHPTFRAQIEQTNFQLDALGEIQVRATVDFSDSSSNAQTKAENPEPQSSKVTATPVQALSDSTDNLDQDDAGQSHYFLFNFRIFNNYAQDFLNAVVENNNYFVVRPEYGYVNALDIIAKLENINVAYYAFLNNLSEPKGYGVVSLTNSSNYDSVTVQQAIVHSVEQTFDNVIDFPNWKKAVKQTIIDPSTGLALESKASKALAKIFSSLNNIINQPGLKNDKVNYNLSFDNASQQLIIGISIYNDNNERVATQNIIIAGFAPSLPALTTIKNLGSDLYFDGAALQTVDEKNKGSKKVLPSLLNNNFVFEAKDNSKLEVNQVNGLSGIVLDSGELTLENNTPKPAPQSNLVPGTSAGANGGPAAAQTLQTQQQVVQTQNQPSSFGIVFSEDNSLEGNKPRIILQEKPKEAQASQQGVGAQTQHATTTQNQDDSVLFVEKVSNISTVKGLDNLKNKKIIENGKNGPVWVIGFGDKNSIDNLTTSSTTSGINNKVEILAAFPVEANDNSTSKATTFVLTIDRNDDKIQVNAASFDGKDTKKQNTFELDKSSASQAITLLENLGKQDSSIVLGLQKSSTPTTSPTPAPTASPSSPSSNDSATTQSTPNDSKTTLHALTFYNAKQFESSAATKPSAAPQQPQASSQPTAPAATTTKELQPSAVFEALLKSYTKN